MLKDAHLGLLFYLGPVFFPWLMDRTRHERMPFFTFIFSDMCFIGFSLAGSDFGMLIWSAGASRDHCSSGLSSPLFWCCRLETVFKDSAQDSFQGHNELSICVFSLWSWDWNCWQIVRDGSPLEYFSIPHHFMREKEQHCQMCNLKHSHQSETSIMPCEIPEMPEAVHIVISFIQCI